MPLLAGPILTINGGSSSVRFALFEDAPAMRRLLSGKVERVGQPGASMSVTYADGRRAMVPGVVVGAAPDVAGPLADWLARQPELAAPRAIGHRVVHGGERFSNPVPVTDDVLAGLRALTPLDPEHLPAEITLLEAFARRYPGVPQIACFDTAFHRDLPPVARTLPLPLRLRERGVRRYGFHGLSYTYLVGELARLAAGQPIPSRAILAHLGSGASLAAVRDGRGVDTTMSFTPAAGIPMGTRSGDLDPGLFRYLAREQNLSPEQVDHLVNHESGLLGLSETTADVRDLLARAPADPRAALAIDLFCYQARKAIGSFAAALGGLDALVFAGGVGEHAPPVRARICDGLQFLGIELDTGRNDADAPLISRDGSRVAVRVIPTDEEQVIARAAREVAAGTASDRAS